MEHQGAEDAEQWARDLENPLPGGAGAGSFDDSFSQIKQQ